MPVKCDISEFLNIDYCLFDVRSPAEFEKGNIPNSINLPLFSNAERAIVGTAYFKSGKDEAIKIGIEKVQKKLVKFIETVSAKTNNKKVRLYCWRGGMRSNSMAWLLDTAGFEVYLLDNGYKNFRNFALKYFEKNTFKFLVITGFTGSGKTELLKKLENNGEQILDLELLANHKGSVFGQLGKTKQPTVQQFENELFFKLYNFNSDKVIWVEDESINIGNVYIPNAIFNKMSSAPKIFVEMDINIRINRLIKEYACFDNEQLIYSVSKIKKRIGGDISNLIIDEIQKNNYFEAIKLILSYYDKLYNKSINLSNIKTKINFETNENIDKLIKIKNQIYG